MDEAELYKMEPTSEEYGTCGQYGDDEVSPDDVVGIEEELLELLHGCGCFGSEEKGQDGYGDCAEQGGEHGGLYHEGVVSAVA